MICGRFAPGAWVLTEQQTLRPDGETSWSETASYRCDASRNFRHNAYRNHYIYNTLKVNSVASITVKHDNNV